MDTLDVHPFQTAKIIFVNSAKFHCPEAFYLRTMDFSC